MTGLHRTTVARLLTDEGRAKLEAELNDKSVGTSHKKEIKPYVPHELAIDEIYLTRRRKLITLIDRELSRLIAIIETNRRGTARALDKFFTVADDDGVGGDIKVTPSRITMDMCISYRKYFSKRFPDAKIIIDRWHVEKSLTKRFTKILNEKREWRAIGSGPNVKFETKRLQPRECGILYTKFSNIYCETAEQGEIPRKEKLRQLLLGRPHMISAWEYRQRFDEIWSSKTEKDAKKLLIGWRGVMPDELTEYKNFDKYMGEWQKQFLNYFEFPKSRVTNAIAESINSILRSCYKRYKRTWNFGEFKTFAFAEVNKNKPPAMCAICGEVCYPELTSGTDYTSYLNYKQIIPAERPRKNFRKQAAPVLEVLCLQCRSEGDVVEDENCGAPIDEHIAKQSQVDERRPYTSRDLDDFLEEMRNDFALSGMGQGRQEAAANSEKEKEQREVRCQPDKAHVRLGGAFSCQLIPSRYLESGAHLATRSDVESENRKRLGC